MPTRKDPLQNQGKTQDPITIQRDPLSEAPKIPSPETKVIILQLLHERNTEQALALCEGFGDPFLLLQSQFNAAKNQCGKDLLAAEYFEATQSKINFSLQELMGQTMEPPRKVGVLSKILNLFKYCFVMKAKIFCSILATTILPNLLFSQTDAWFQKGLASTVPKEQIEYFTKSIEQNGPTANAYYNRGNAKDALEDYPGAISDYSKAIELDPKFWLAYFGRGEAEYRMQDYPGAILDYSKVIELAPEIAVAYSGRGSAKFQLQDYPGAISDYSKYIELGPKDAPDYFNRAVTHDALEDYPSAISDYLKAIELDPEYASPYHNLGILYAGQNDYDAAIEILEKARQNDVHESTLLDNLGHYYLKKENYDKAIERFIDCLKIGDQGDALDAALGLSLAYFYKDDKQNAKKYLDQARKIKPVLNQGMDGLLELELEGYFYSEKSKESFKRMFNRDYATIHIEPTKTKKSKAKIEKDLVGYWAFYEMRSLDGEKLDTIFHSFGYEVAERPDFIFNSDRTYSTGENITDGTTNGTWEYNEQKGEVVLTFHHSILNIPAEQMDPAYVQQLKDQGAVFEIKNSFFEISNINKQELVLIEWTAEGEHGPIFNLIYYKKKK